MAMGKKCRRCPGRIPSRIRIAGRSYVIQNRTHCLDCLPFKTGRLRTNPVAEGGTTTCRECGRKYKYTPKSGQSRRRCNSCITAARRERVKTLALQLLGGKCLLCGYDRCPAALTFHHLDSNEKNFTIGQAYNRRWAAIEAEVRKCVLLCSNCHAEVHAGVAKIPGT